MSKGMSRRNDKIYHIYYSIKHRCYNPNSNAYKNYGGRGITMCDEWLNDFEVFKKWILEHGYEYSKGRSEQQLDRIDNNKGYSPDNCRIVTLKENTRNTRQNVHITYNGETLTPGEWAEKLGIPAPRIRRRMSFTDDPEKILSLELRSSMSNTGIKGITYVKSKKEYVVHIKNKYIGASQTLDGAIKIKEEYENGK